MMGKESCPSGDGLPAGGGSGGLSHNPFLIGFGTAGQGRSRQRFRQQGIGFQAVIIITGMVGGIYPEIVREVPKAEPRFVRLAGAPHVAQPGLSQRDTHAIYRHPNPRCQIKSWLRVHFVVTVHNRCSMLAQVRGATSRNLVRSAGLLLREVPVHVCVRKTTKQAWAH